MSGIDYESIDSFSCFGYNGKALMELLNSTVYIVCGFIPLMIFVVLLILLYTVVTPGFRTVSQF